MTVSCKLLVRATGCCVTVLACTSGGGNMLLWYTIAEGIACCEILFITNKLEFSDIFIWVFCFLIGCCSY